jgi:hypothetical protein
MIQAGEADLLEIVFALRAPAGFPGRLDSGQKKRDRMPMMAITTSNSTSVNALGVRLLKRF